MLLNCRKQVSRSLVTSIAPFRNPSVYFGTVLFVKEEEDGFEATVITNNRSIMGEGSWNLRSGRYCLPLSACVVGPQCILPMHFELEGTNLLESDRYVASGKWIGISSRILRVKKYRELVDRSGRIPSRF